MPSPPYKARFRVRPSFSRALVTDSAASLPLWPTSYRLPTPHGRSGLRHPGRSQRHPRRSAAAEDHYAISVRESADTYDQDIACGDVGGAIGDDGLALGLGARNGSGYSGLALLRPTGDATEVTIYLVRESGGLRASAEQAALAGTAESEAVAIKNFTFDPPAIEVPVGLSVTWTNDDNAPHTATGANGAIPQSGALPFAASFTQVFDAPGIYDYICVYHPNMKGIIVVK
jgi:plastocyanin